MKPVTFGRLIEMNLDELHGLRESDVPESLRLYWQTLRLYLKADMTALDQHLEKCLTVAKPDGVTSCIRELTRIRFKIRARRILGHDVDAFVGSISALTRDCPEWEGEALFVAALAYETCGDEDASARLYAEACEKLEKAGSPRKALKSAFNGLATRSRVGMPERKFLVDWHHFIRKAKKARATSVVGVAYTNISRVYQQMGSLSSALRHANRALGYLKKYDYGTLDHAIATIHRCHVLTDLGLRAEAQIDFETASTVDFPEIREALQVLRFIQGKINRAEASQISRTLLTPSWNERLTEALARPDSRASKKESAPVRAQQRTEDLGSRLIELLGVRPRDKFELIRELYGERLDLEVTENRLKNLLNRTRKRFPDLIRHHDGKYSLADQALVPISLKKIS